MQKNNLQSGFAVGIAVGIIALLTLAGGGAYVAYEQRTNATVDVNTDANAEVSEKGSSWFRFGSDNDGETNASIEGRTNADLNADVNANINSNTDVAADASTTYRIDTDLDAGVDADINL